MMLQSGVGCPESYPEAGAGAAAPLNQMWQKLDADPLRRRLRVTESGVSYRLRDE